MADPYQVTRDFEQAVAEFAGAKYGIATDSCTSALFLSLRYERRNMKYVTTIEVPKRTYPSVPMAVVNANYSIKWVDLRWSGTYLLYPASVVDGAKRFRRGMYLDTVYMRTHLHCLSFHSKKLLPIGRGGMVLTDDKVAADWLRLMRFDGREECSLSEQKSFDVIGWNCYMTPEQAARGLQLLACYKDQPDQIEEPPYPDCSLMNCFKPYTVN